MTDKAENEMDGSKWHLDKRVPITLIITIAFQTLAVVWFGAQLVSRVENLEKSDVAQAQAITSLAEQDRFHDRNIAVIKESNRYISKQLDVINNKVDELLKAN